VPRVPQPVLGERALNRALLARQSLLERAAVSVPRALELMGGLQDQYAPSGYVGLWSRVAGFARDDLTRALERKTVVQATLMRATIHLVSRRDFWPIAEAVAGPLLEWWFRSTKREGDRAALRRIDRRACRLLADGPRRRSEIIEALGLDASTWAGVGLFTPTVRVPPSGTWERRRADLYACAHDWIGPSTSDPRSGTALLVRRYVAAFGPSAPKDIASFTSLPAATVGDALDGLTLRRFRAEDGAELVDLPRAPRPAPDAPAPVRFLPTWDATLLVHARRTQIVPERYRSQVFHVKLPQSVPVFLVDGQVAGTWRYDGSRVMTSAFEPLPRTVRRQVEEEAALLGAFHA